MDFLSKIVGGAYGPKKTPQGSAANDPQTRLSRFKRAFNTVHDLCNRPRDISNEGPVLDQLSIALDRLVQLIRDETRAPVPHLCLQFAATSQLYTLIGRAAIVSGYGPVLHAAVAVYAALIDSEEEDFVSSAPFAKSLMRLVTKAVDSETFITSLETETAILELLFTITAKIRLEPEILPIWFRSTAKPELEDVFVKEKRSFVGITQKDDFPLCYMLIDRVHQDGRIGDFARTGILYVFEATGRSTSLEEWVISSDLPTLIASGLGALYSQLSRELSILHPDATLPPVLAMSDYSTMQAKATAEPAFSARHQAHMLTFLSYLAFWQDVLDHCRSADVKQTLLDHFQILFLQQLLYPSLLQSSDTDAGSSVAVLTYMIAMLDALEYPDLIHMMLTYLLAITDDAEALPSTPATPVQPPMPPRLPSNMRRRESLILLTAPKDTDETSEPTLFNLVDLILNSVRSKNSQTVFSALKLTATMMIRQRKYALRTLLKVHEPIPSNAGSSGSATTDSGSHLSVITESMNSEQIKQRVATRLSGAFELELAKFTGLVTVLYNDAFPEEAYSCLCVDVRHHIESQVPLGIAGSTNEEIKPATYALLSNDPLMQALRSLLRTFLTNSVDVNLALTEAIVAIVSCVELRLDTWMAFEALPYDNGSTSVEPERTWHAFLDKEEVAALSRLRNTCDTSVWADTKAPLLYATLRTITKELEHVRDTVPAFDQLLAGRQTMLQATDAISLNEPPPLASSPTHASFLGGPKQVSGHSRSPSASSQSRGRRAAAVTASNRTSSPQPPRSQAASPASTQLIQMELGSSARVTASIFQPPPPETPSTTDVLMQKVTFPSAADDVKYDGADEKHGMRSATLNHVLTNTVVLQQFAVELLAVLQVRAAVLGEREVCSG